jgi:phospholipid/cholesterol/gamma-HCH transport system substrate-binding protein
MAERRTYFLVGLFVVVGVLMGVAAVIWLGASKYFQKGSMYATYFDESVQGLQVDSIVQFRGVSVGSVRQIGVAPDQRLVEVLMKIDVQNFQVEGVAAKLTMAGITGIVYVQLDLIAPGEPSLLPKGFEPQYPVIPSAPSNIKKIEASITDILKSIREIDFKGISDQLVKTTKTIDGFVSSDRVNHIMTSLGTASTSLASASERIDGLLRSGSIDEVVEGAREVVEGARDAIRETRSVIGLVKTEIDGVKLAETSSRVNMLVEGASGRMHSALTEVEVTMETLRRASDALETLIERLNRDPSDLIFSSPPKGE